MGPAGPQGPAGSFSGVVNRDALASVTSGQTVTLTSFCESGEVATGGSVNLIPDGTPLTITTQRPVGNTFGDSPDNGTSAIGWRAQVTAGGSGLLVVHVFCAH
ncbi:hypothetical protein [Sorangium sp. So ce1078]|uniref:hypothetical protein n=1 Tax=Sorangium sp. So ce1078 TaxID=3133329 RepID=UPI003F64354F